MVSLLKSFKIRSLEFPVNLIQGPLAGYSCAPFRELVWRYGGVAYCVTEMLSAHSLAHGYPQAKRYLYRSPLEKALCVQIAASKVEIAARACTKIEELHIADLIDLNCGCPQPKIRSKGQGSKLLSSPDTLHAMMMAMRQVTDLPLTAKIRIDSINDLFNKEVMQALAAGGADAIIVHGRHWQERYDVPVRVDVIAQLVNQVSIPVIANGDVDSIEAFEAMLTKTNCAAVMVARAGLGKPWLYAQMAGTLPDRSAAIANLSLQMELITAHVQGLIGLEGEHVAMLQSRKLFKYYFDLNQVDVVIRDQINHLSDYNNFESVLDCLMKD